MNMHWSRYLVLLILCGLAPGVEAQTILAELEIGKREPKPDFLEYSPPDKGLVTLGPMTKTSTRIMGIRKYNGNLEEEWSTKVFEQNGRKHLDFMTVIGDYILIFISEHFPKEKVIKTYYYGYNRDGTQIADQEILSIYPNQKEQKVVMQYVMSPNKRQLLLFKNLKNERESEEILYYLYDEEADLVLNGEFTMKYPDNKFRVETVRVSNSGNIFLLGKFFTKSNVRSIGDYRYLIMRYDVGTETLTEIPVDLRDRFVTDLAFRLDPYENIYVAGFYSNRAADMIAGTLLLRINKLGEVELRTVQEFDREFVGQYLSANQIAKGKELKSFYLNKENGIILRSDGGVLLLAEKFYVTYMSYRDMYGYWVDKEYYHYEDVIVTSVDPEGKIEWQAIVNKNQVSDNPSRLSFFNAIGRGKNYIFYEERLQRKGLNIYYNTVDMNGEVSKQQPLFREYRNDNAFFPQYCQQTSNTEALLSYYGQGGKVFRVVKLRFDE